jgi:hypothetical protein
MPDECQVHAHDTAQSLEPEGITQACQQFGRSVILEDAFRDSRAELSHAIGEPGGNASAMERKVGCAGALHRFLPEVNVLMKLSTTSCGTVAATFTTRPSCLTSMPS